MNGQPAPAIRLLPHVLLFGLAILLAVAPQFVRLPTPRADIVLDRADFAIEGEARETIALPHAWPRGVPYGPARGRYELTFSLPEQPSEPLYLVIRAARHHLEARLNGHPLAQASGEPWIDPSAGAARRLHMPARTLQAGENRLSLSLERKYGAVPGYLSPVYIGGEPMIAGDRWARLFGTERVRAAAHALHLLIIVALATLWSTRQRDPVFGWLFLIGVASFAVAVPSELDVSPSLAFMKPYLVLFFPAFGLMAMGLCLAIAGSPSPRWLRYSVVGLPAVLLAAVASGAVPAFLAVMLASAIALATHLAAAVIVTRAFLRTGRWDVGLLAVPFFLTGWYGIRDVAVVMGLLDGPFLLSGFVRPLTMLVVLMLLMRRLTLSLEELDGANDNLRRRLAEREAELSLLHEKERLRTAQSVREQERQRLMHDLHDGLSGHLVSIIALSERAKADREAIERAAREALNDLRLVINSLDIGDRDLPLALASFRERLERQLRRLGVDLSWSMERLPEVRGLTPASALSIVRILQEAVTNALKHGPATRIAICASEGAAGEAMLTVENDGARTLGAGKGHGLDNMRRRAEQLGGQLGLAPKGDGMMLTLALPAALSEPAA